MKTKIFNIVTHEWLWRVVEAWLIHVAAKVKTEDWLTLTVESAPGRRAYVDASNDGDIICRLRIRLDLYVSE